MSKDIQSHLLSSNRAWPTVDLCLAREGIAITTFGTLFFLATCIQRLSQIPSSSSEHVVALHFFMRSINFCESLLRGRYRIDPDHGSAAAKALSPPELPLISRTIERDCVAMEGIVMLVPGYFLPGGPASRSTELLSG